MGVTIEIGLPGQTKADALAVPVARPPHGLGGEGGRIVDGKLDGALTRLLASGELRGDTGEALVLHVEGALETLPLSLADQARALVEGTILGGYAPGRWKTQDDRPPTPIERIVLGHFDTLELRHAAERAAPARCTEWAPSPRSDCPCGQSR